MKRRTTLILLTAMAVLIVSAAAAEGTPRAVPLEPIKEFDIVAKGDVITHAFEIKNEGDTALELTEVRPACGCTVAKFDRSIAPGDVGKVNVKVKTDNFAGPISKSISVFTNDSENPKLMLVVKADVKPYIEVRPGYARYSHVRGEQMPTATQVLWAEDGADLKIVDVKAPYSHLKVTYREATEEERNPNGAGRQWHLEFELSPESPIGPLGNHVLVTLDHSKQKTVKIPISGFVRPRQHVTPDKADFGKLENLPHQRRFHFHNFTSAPVELTSIETGFDAITAEVRPSKKEGEQGYRYTVLVKVGPEMPKGTFDGTVKININDERNPVIEIPFKGTVL